MNQQAYGDHCQAREGRLTSCTFRAQSTASNLAPVFQTLVAQTLNGSSQALILFASSGTNTSLSSSSVCVQVNVAIKAPADVPVIIRGRRFASRNALTTPKWSASHIVSQFLCVQFEYLQYAKVAPPERQRAVRPRLVLAFLKNRAFSSRVRSEVSRIYLSALSSSSIYAESESVERKGTRPDVSHSIKSLVP